MLSLALALLMQAGSGQVVLAWDANSETDLAGYKVYKGTASRAYTLAVDLPGKSSSPTHTVTGLSAGMWYFAVTAYNTAGQESGYSNEVSTAITLPPQPPTGLRITSQSASLRWFGVVLLATTDQAASATFRYQKIGTNGWSTVIATPTPTKTEHRVVLYLPKVVDYFKYEWTVTSAGGEIATGTGTFETR